MGRQRVSAKKRNRAVSSPEELYRLWKEYVAECGQRTITKTIIDRTTHKRVDTDMLAPVTPKIKGFCLDKLGLSEQALYATYFNDSEYDEVKTLIREDCEVRAVESFEQGAVDAKLAGLLLSKYGYGLREQRELDAQIKISMTPELARFAD